MKLHPCRPGLHFHEEQRFPVVAAWILLAAGCVVVVDLGVPTLPEGMQLPGTVLAVVGTVGLMGLAAVFDVRIELTDDELVFCVRPFYERRIAVDDILQVRAFMWVPQGNWVRWRLWGWRPVESTHGVQLVLKGGETVLIIAMHADGLVMSIRDLKGIGLLKR